MFCVSIILEHAFVLGMTTDPKPKHTVRHFDGQRAIAAPFRLGPILKADVTGELARLREFRPGSEAGDGVPAFLAALGVEAKPVGAPQNGGDLLPMVADDRQAEQVRQLQDFTQKLIPLCERERD